jgi:hypothetical protein
MPLKKQPNYNYQTYSQAMATVAQLQKLGIPVEQVMEVDPGALVSTPDSQSGVACYAPTDPDFVPDANLHQYTAKVWGGVRQELGLLQQQLDGHTGRDGVLGLAQQCLGDSLKALSAVWDLPAIVAATEAALKV